MRKTIKLSIISPAHNEEETVVSFVHNAVNFIHKNKLSGEVIIVENGSHDKTISLLHELQQKFKNELVVKSLSAGNKGLALKEGFKLAQGEFIVTLDMDLWDDDFVTKSITNLETYDIVVGSKSLSESKDQRVITSRLMNWGYNLLFRLVFNLHGTETHAKLSFKKDQILPLVIDCKTEDLNFDTELIIRAERSGLTKLEIPTTIKEIRPRTFSVLSQLIKTVKNFVTLLKVLGPSPNWSYILVFVGLLIGSILRFTHYKDWFFFSVDEEHYSFMTRMITVDHHFPLIGGPISGTKLYMAPWFLYFNAIFFFLSHNDPLLSGLVYCAIELFTTVIIYFIGKKLFSSRAAAIASLLYSSSFLMSLFDRHYWNIMLTPFLTALIFYCLLRFLEGGKKWLIFVSILVGFGLSTTFSMFAVFIFAFVVILFFKKPMIKKDLGIFLLIVAAMHIPLVFFDMRHNFELFHGLIQFLTVHSYDQVPFLTRIVNTLVLFFQTLGKSLVITTPIDVSDEISICTSRVMRFSPQLWSILLGVGALGGYLLIGIKEKKKEVWLIGLLCVINIGSLFLFRADPAQRHWLPFLPFFFLTVGATLSLLIQSFGKLAKVAVFIVVAILITLNLWSFSASYASYSLTDKEEAVKIVIFKTQAGEFSFDAVGDCNKWGYRYLFAEFNHEPSESYLDSSFSWMYSSPPTPQATKTKITFFAPNEHAPLNSFESERKQILLKSAGQVIISSPIMIFIDK